MSITTEQATAYRGRNAIGADGEKLGTIEEIYLDAETNRPEWLAVKTGLFGTRTSFIPIADATEADGAIQVPYDKAHVKDAPHVEPDGQLSQREEAELYRHYGLEYSEARSDTGLAGSGTDSTTSGSGTTDARTTDAGTERGGPGHDVSGPSTDDAMTRSEEELAVGTAQRETGRVRLRKHVVTENVTQTVPVSREEVRVEREPITDANAGAAHDGPDLSEEEHEVVLHAEEPVAEKRVVPKERVRLDKDVEVEEQTVSDEVRRERIDVDDGRA